MQFLKKHKVHILLTIIVVFGALLRFYKLDWGHGLFTHPDEYHIVASVNQLSFPTLMHPHFFSYGTVTIYLIYFTQEILKYLFTIYHLPSTIFNPFLIGRFYSALFSTLTILIVYKICRTFMQRHFSLLAALLTAITPGLIQQAHFATPESALTFFLFGSLLFMIKFSKQNKFLYLVLASLFLGFSLAVKISSIVFLLPLIATIAFRVFSIHYLRGDRNGLLGGGEGIRPSTPSAAGIAFGDAQPRWTLKKTELMLKALLKFIGLALTSIIIIVATFFLVAPYVFIDYPAFRSNLDYEGGLAVGKIPVFYTRQFIDTTPVLFQMEKILPYALGPALLILSLLGFFLFVPVPKHLGWWRKHQTFDSSRRWHSLWRRTAEVDGHLRGVHPRFVRLRRTSPGESATSKVFIIITIAFLSLFISNAFLFAKWTRFIAPTFPFFAIFAAFLLQSLTQKTKTLSYTLGILLIVNSSLWTMAFFSIYTSRDVRITASEWLESHVKPASSFLVEGGNMIDLPLHGGFPRTSLDFYTLEENPLTREKIVDGLYTSDYFLVQSRRVFYNHQRLSDLFPKTAAFYNALFNGKMGFEQIKEFHSYPTLEVGSWKLEVADEEAEETWSVFDHPVIRVFKKNKQLSQDQYRYIIDGGKL